jgi:putative DNA primase/helicase
MSMPAATTDLRTGLSRTPRPEDYNTKVTRAGGLALAGTPCSLWMNFLRRVCGGDEELVAFLQRWCGYCLTGITTEQVLVYLYGTGANGKSVFVSTVAGILGDYAAVAPMEMLLASKNERHPTELAKLMGVRLVTAHEVAGGRRWDEDKIKLLTGGDKLTARFMRQDFFEFTPKFKLMIFGNHKPTLRNVDEAIKRRFLLVPFTVTIPEAERDPDLVEKLKPEWPAILRWMINGCLEWQRLGHLGIPAKVRDASNEYFADQDSIGQWIEEALSCHDDRAFTRTADLFTAWREWCTLRNLTAGSVKGFSQALADRGLAKKRDNVAKWGFKGVTFRHGG